MELWRKAEFAGERIVIDALVRRRAAEKLLFLTPSGDAFIPAPSGVLQPLLDRDAFDLVLRQQPALVSASMDGETVLVTRADTPRPTEREEDEIIGPVKAAAEAITARLQTIFPDAGVQPAAVEPPVHPENIPAEAHPQADFAAPTAGEPVVLVAPAYEGDSDAFINRAPDGEDSASDDFRGPDLSGQSAPSNDVVEDVGFPLDDAAPRTMIDDAAPFDFGAAVPRPLPEPPKGGLLSLVALAILGLAFFAGGVFWATNARPVADEKLLSPMIVGWLAGVAGVIFFAVAVFLLLQRLGQATERAAKVRTR